MKLRKKKQVVVVGNGMAGLRFCEKLLEYDAFHEYRMTVLGDERLPAYDRISLSSIFQGKSEHELILAEKRWYDSQQIELRPGLRVVSIDRDGKYLTTHTGDEISYDILVLDTAGTGRRREAIPGTELSGVHVYRTLDDIEAIRKDSLNAKNAVIIGGGLLGLEAAEICNEKGLRTTVIERAPEHYVDIVSGAPVSPYTNWANAATSIHDAVSVAHEQSHLREQHVLRRAVLRHLEHQLAHVGGQPRVWHEHRLLLQRSDGYEREHLGGPDVRGRCGLQPAVGLARVVADV